MQIQAPIALSLFIKHYLFIDVKTNHAKKYRLFSNGNTCLALVLKGQNKIGKINSKSLLLGQFTQFTDLEFSEDTKLLVVVFQPYGLHMISKIPGREFQNLILEAQLILGNSVDHLYSIIQEHSNIQKIVPQLNRYFADNFLKQDLEHSSLISNIVHEIINKRGKVTLKEISEGYFVHERKLQRIFSDYVGLSPKRFIQIVKLHSFLGFIRANSSCYLTGLSYEAGYFDQSHLIKEFKSMTGMTPTKYSKALSLAVNLVEIN